VLLTAAWALVGLSVADLLFATTAGETLVFGPVIGLVLGWLAGRNGASRRASRLAIGVNAAVLVITAVAIMLLGGT